MVKPEKVGVLIGQDIDDAIEIIMTRPTLPLAPIVKLTRSAWIVVGKISNRYETRQAGDRHQNVCLIRKISNAKLKWTMEKFWAMESYGVIPRSNLMTPEDKRALQLIQSTVEKTEGVVGLPWIHDAPTLSNNRDSVMKRFFGLENNSRKRPDYAVR